MRAIRDFGSEAGISVGQVVGFVVLAGLLYLGYLYLPLLIHRMQMAEVGRDYAAKMILNGNDQEIREAISQDENAKALGVGPSDVRLDRPSDGTQIVTIHWREQPRPFWNPAQVIDMSVTEHDRVGKIGLKNAE